jgi:hypothetical protein
MKISTNLSIDSVIWAEAKLKIKNISLVVENFLKTYLEMPDEKKGYNEYTIDSEIEKFMVKIAELKKRKKEIKNQEKRNHIKTFKIE